MALIKETLKIVLLRKTLVGRRNRRALRGHKLPRLKSLVPRRPRQRKRYATGRILNTRTIPAGSMGDKVAVGGFGKASGHGLCTQNLATCIGIVIQGNAPPTNPHANTRWLLHLVLEDQWAPFAAPVRAEGLLNMQGWISVPMTTAIGTQISVRDTTVLTSIQQDQDFSTKRIRTTKAAVVSLTGRSCKVKSHPMNPPTSMQISSDGEVSAAGGTGGFV
ncbi:hypothetical protein GLAREA_04910 [Glarea lozoyensis ATCC 20868]|uniref:Uncharacterized protein n=1 Tax=Glarea lozoyensis (strain ATCC 20868 / MF5171) TaxID=1116229 RepID=S3CSR4_GLAL2|nr:uncharacterized protein GLAREA_04910 [Glarea lozoyensis ATCC 20868]EPE28119.1 hypothetical protein GLAREA_04910 [Glarea lozoyensis ATCC 20868]